MGSYLQKPVVQKESYEGTGQEFGLQEFLDLSFFLNKANHGMTDSFRCVDPWAQP